MYDNRNEELYYPELNESEPLTLKEALVGILAVLFIGSIIAYFSYSGYVYGEEQIQKCKDDGYTSATVKVNRGTISAICKNK